MIDELYEIIMDRKKNPVEGSYTSRLLFEKGLDGILKKVGEECIEVIVAAKNGKKEELVYEIADLTYHLLVLMAALEITPDDVRKELKKRRR
jgi:phosphoribosyl-ATP pyrophosphohydrolase